MVWGGSSSSSNRFSSTFAARCWIIIVALRCILSTVRYPQVENIARRLRDVFSHVTPFLQGNLPVLGLDGLGGSEVVVFQHG